MITDFERVKLFLLSDLIDDILFDKKFEFEDKMNYKKISNAGKNMSRHIIEKNDLSNEYDLYKLKINDFINKTMNESIE